MSIPQEGMGRGSLAGEKVLVTGATGLLGPYVVDALLRCGKSVTVLTRDPKRAANRWHDAARMTIARGDLTRPSTIQHLCRGVDLVVHMASHSPRRGTDSGTGQFHHMVTVGGTKALLEVAIRAHCRGFIFISSVKAMGEGATTRLDESSAARPETAYGQAKLDAEHMVLQVGKEHGLHACCLRLPMVYAPDCRGGLAGMISAVERGWLPPPPEAAGRHSMVDARDVATAILLLTSRTEASGRTYIVTDGQDYSVRDVYDLICGALGRKSSGRTVPLSVLRWFARAGDAVQRATRLKVPFTSNQFRKLSESECYSSRRIREELGFRPERRLSTTLPEMIQNFRAAREKCQA